MNMEAGIGLIAGGMLAALCTAFVLWDRAARAFGPVLAAASGAAVGTGAILIQAHPTIADAALAVGVLTALTPVHLRVLFGRPGMRGKA